LVNVSVIQDHHIPAIRQDGVHDAFKESPAIEGHLAPPARGGYALCNDAFALPSHDASSASFGGSKASLANSMRPRRMSASASARVLSVDSASSRDAGAFDAA